MTLCDECNAISLASMLSNDGHVLHPNLRSLYNNALKCELCHLILSYLRREIEARRAAIVAGRDSDERLPMITSLHAAAHGSTELTSDILSSMAVALRHSQEYEFRVKNGSSSPPPRRKPEQFSFLDVICGRVQYGNFYVSASIQAYVHLGSSTMLPLDIAGKVAIPFSTDHKITDDTLQSLGFQVRDRLAPHSTDPAVIAKVKNWMRHCATAHLECRTKGPGPGQNPRRLLDLRSTDHAQLFPIIDVPADFRDEYVALSYCWGKVPKSWIDYLGQVQHSTTRLVDGRLVPKTVKDAITSCIALGYLYLWVDCICIIQDDPSDWLQESARMDRVFANSALVISASATANCTDGFLAPRSQSQQQGIIVPLHVKDDHRPETTSNLHLCLPDSGFERTIGAGPVVGRAWCLQERQLAPRVLHICQDSVTFECTLSRRFESESLPMAEFDIHSERHRLHIPGEKYLCANPKPSAHVQSILMWYATVEDYTLRRLTVASDKLIAISGLAKRAHSDLEGRYLAGIWQQQVHVGLAWMVANHLSLAIRAPVYRAPSWSWASVDGPVNWQLIDGFVQSNDGFLASAIDLLDFAIELVSPDPFGPITYADILLRGALLEIPVKALSHNKIFEYPAWMSGKFPGIIGCYIEDEKNAVKSSTIICLKIGTRPFGPGPSLPPTNEMLILEPVKPPMLSRYGSGIGVYRRIGFGQVLVTDYFDTAPTVKLALI